MGQKSRHTGEKKKDKLEKKTKCLSRSVFFLDRPCGAWGPRRRRSSGEGGGGEVCRFLFFFFASLLSLLKPNGSLVVRGGTPPRTAPGNFFFFYIQAGRQGGRNVTFTSTFLEFWHSTSLVSRRKHTNISSQFVGRSMSTGGGGPTIQIRDVKVPWSDGGGEVPPWRCRRWGWGVRGGRLGVWVLVCLYCPEFAF